MLVHAVVFYSSTCVQLCAVPPSNPWQDRSTALGPAKVKTVSDPRYLIKAQRYSVARNHWICDYRVSAQPAAVQSPGGETSDLVTVSPLLCTGLSSLHSTRVSRHKLRAFHSTSMSLGRQPPPQTRQTSKSPTNYYSCAAHSSLTGVTAFA